MMLDVNLETVSTKHLNEMEQSIRTLLTIMRQAKLQNEPIAQSLRELELEIGQVRRERFDKANPEYHSY